LDQLTSLIIGRARKFKEKREEKTTPLGFA
jgi:hypothetical protein